MDAIIDIVTNFKTFFETLSGSLPSFDLNAWLEHIQTPQFLLTALLNVLIAITVYVSIKAMLVEYRNYRMMQKLQGKVKTKKKGENPLLQLSALRKLHDTLTFTLRQKNKLDKRDTVFYGLLAGILGISLLMATSEQYLLAVIIPFFLLDYIVKVLLSMEVDDLEYMHTQLPRGIDALLKSATKYGDLKNIFFEASRSLPYPIREEFEVMARHMNSRESEEVLMTFKDKYDDIWLNSFVFILLSMTNDAERDLSLDNLRNLRDMLSAENNLRVASVTDKRLSVNTNYALAGIAAVIGIGTVLFTEVGPTFYFSTPLGLASFIGGYALVLATIQINVRLSSTKDKR